MSKELFNKKYVHFMWSDELNGKECFVADRIDVLRDYVERNVTVAKINVLKSDYESTPFTYIEEANVFNKDYIFAYYDPNYECKVAFNEGKTIQVKNCRNEWIDCNPTWNKEYEYRIKPETEKKYRAFKNTDELINYVLKRDNIPINKNARLPLIWVKSSSGVKMLITGFSEHEVLVSGELYSLAWLCENCTFLDGTKCGVID